MCAACERAGLLRTKYRTGCVARQLARKMVDLDGGRIMNLEVEAACNNFQK